jgi:hypothetical protein
MDTAESPTVDGLKLAAGMKERFPVRFHAYIEAELWECIGDIYSWEGGYREVGLHVLAPIGPIYAINPLREMGLLC